MSANMYSRSVAANMVIANMIGTGIFTSIGFQVMPGAIPDPFSIMMIWLIGGVFSLCGALAYAEVATTLKESGGEYTFLSRIYHPVLGLASGWVSLIVGFSAAIASLALATGEYLGPLVDSIGLGFSTEIATKTIGVSLIAIVSLIQLRGVESGGGFQNIMTNVKLLFIAVLILAPLLFLTDGDASGVSFAPTDKTGDTILGMPFAGSLVWVLFAYSGWNASAYIAGNMIEPKKNLPYSLLVGTGAVTLIYLALTAVFMYTCKFEEMAGVVDVGNVVVNKVFSPDVALVFGALFAVALVAGINAMFIAGPRVTQKMGLDHQIFSILGKQSESGAPTNAIILQALLSSIMVLFSDFKSIIEYIGITLTIFSVMTVIGVFVLRAKGMTNENTIKTWGYPITPIVFIAVSVWMVVYFAMNEPEKIMWSAAT
ncbi:MAG: APC family permease, partial [Bacteroidota bacterium]